MRRLLVSVGGPNEASAIAEGGAHIADVECPASALGTPYPLNLKAVRERLDGTGRTRTSTSTNIGETQPGRSVAWKAALRVALAGADYVKCGLAGLDLKSAEYLGRNLVRTIRQWFPGKKVYPVVFAEPAFAQIFDPLKDGMRLVAAIDCDGLLIDTYDKARGMGLVDYFSVDEVAQFAADLHAIGKEAWIAGSITEEDLPMLWRTGVDVICVREAVCEPRQGEGRFGEVSESLVVALVKTINRGQRT
ncbi:MAG: hypothetical protein IIA89_11390 [Chloroflexi bacterium]|nr:hypothetical protein [Chloroflexota bacterium]